MCLWRCTNRPGQATQVVKFAFLDQVNSEAFDLTLSVFVKDSQNVDLIRVWIVRVCSVHLNGWVQRVKDVENLVQVGNWCHKVGSVVDFDVV